MSSGFIFTFFLTILCIRASRILNLLQWRARPHSAPGRRIQHFIEHRWRSREKPQEAARSRQKPREAAISLHFAASRGVSRLLAAFGGFSRLLAASRGFHRCSMKCGLDRCGHMTQIHKNFNPAMMHNWDWAASNKAVSGGQHFYTFLILYFTISTISNNKPP